MAYSGRINYINLAEPVETRIKQSVQYSEIVNDLTVTSPTTVPSSVLLKMLSDKVDGISNVSIAVDGTAPSIGALPPADINTGKVYVVDGRVYISDGTSWVDNGAIQGERGEKGDRGTGLELNGTGLTVEELPNPNPLGTGATYLVNGKIYVYEEGKGYNYGGAIEGTNGKSAYEIAVENGFVGTEAEWIVSLKGEAIPFTTTTVADQTNNWKYIPSITIKQTDTLLVFYNGVGLSKNDYSLVAEGQGFAIVLNLEQGLTIESNTVTGMIYRGNIEASPSPSYTLPVATATTLGGVKQGQNVEITADGTLNVTASSNQGLISKFTTTIVNTPIKHYNSSIPFQDGDYIQVHYNGLVLQEGVDWVLEEVVAGAGKSIKLLVTQSDNDLYNSVYGTIYRGFGNIV